MTTAAGQRRGDTKTFPCESSPRNVSPRVATSQRPLHATAHPPQGTRLLLEQKGGRCQVSGSPLRTQ